MAEYLNRMDGATLEEIEKDLTEGIQGLKALTGFFEARSEERIKEYTKEEELFGAPFKLDTSSLQLVTNQFENMGFFQTFKENKSYLKFQEIGDRFWNKAQIPEEMDEWYSVKKIHYKDGTSISQGISDHKISFFWEEEWGDLKVIDRVELAYNLQYIQAYDSLTISKSTKTLKYKDGKVDVKKVDKNHLYITVSDAYAQQIHVRALNKEGKTLSRNSYSFSPTVEKNSANEFDLILKTLEDVLAKLKAKKFKDSESLNTYLLKKINKVKPPKDNDGVVHMKFYFEGNVESVQLYIKTEEGLKTIPFTATNNNPYNEILLKETKEEITFMDAEAKTLFSIPTRNLEQVGNRIFRDDQTFYFLNVSAKSLDSIEAVSISETSNGLLFIQQKIDDDFLVFDATNLKQLSDKQFYEVWNVDKEYTHAMDTNNINYTIDRTGTVKKIEGITEIGNVYEGLLIAKFKDKFGFIEPSGKIVVPTIYSDANHFQEGLAVVKNEEQQYGYVDMEGNVVLPLHYRVANSFENGIALVNYKDEYQLIDKDGNVIVSVKSNGYSITGSGLNKVYDFFDKKYNAFGKLIVE